MKYKIIPLIIVFCLFALSICVPVSEAMEEAAIYQEAKLLYDYVITEDVFSGDVSAEVTREQFVSIINKLFKIEPLEPDIYNFSDVTFERSGANNIYTALKLGFISVGDKFEPDRGIKYNEAIKIAVTALGYSLEAESKGGFPSGYYSVANRKRLLRNLKDTENITLNIYDVHILAYNILNTASMQKISFGAEMKYQEDDETVLNKIHTIYTVTGVVTSTPYNSLTNLDSDQMDGWLGINGKLYRFDNGKPEMLGVRHKVYYKFDESTSETNISLVLKNSEKEILISSIEFGSISGNTLSYYINDKNNELKVRLDESYYLIYNYKKVDNKDDELFKSSAGSVCFVDNDGDGRFDAAFINKYNFTTVRTIDAFNLIISDVNGVNNQLNLGIENCKYIIIDENKTEISILDVSIGDVLKSIKSLDGKLVKAEICRQTGSGFVTGTEDETIYIDDVPYYMSDYFKDFYFNKISYTSKCTFNLTDDGIIISAEFYSEAFSYGYLVGAIVKKSVNQELLLKIFTINNRMEIFEVKDKITLDGQGFNTFGSALYDLLAPGGSVNNQLLRYSVNKDGLINRLDLYKSATDFSSDDEENDSLKKYTFTTNSFVYKSNTGVFSSFFNVNSAAVFCIPSDINDEENYMVTDRSVFVNEKTYTVEAYDVDISGSAKVIVHKGEIVKWITTPFFVEKVTKSVDEDGNSGYLLYLWGNGNYSKVFMKSDVLVEKSAASGTAVDSSHPLLSGGDIIRYGTKSTSEIAELVVEFDARKGVFTPNMSTGSTPFNLETRRTPMHHNGRVYSCENGSIGISKGSLSDFSFNNIRFLNVGSAKILFYDAETGKTRIATTNDIKVYTSDGVGAYYAVICQNDFTTNTIIIYDKPEERI